MNGKVGARYSHERFDVVSLREHVDSQLNAQQRYFEAQIRAINEAVRIALDSINARLATANEFRAALTDQATRLPTRAELAAAIDRISKLENWQSRQEGMASQSSVNIVFVFSAIGILLGLVGIITRFI